MSGIPGIDYRCHYRTADGRRCTMLRMDDHPSLCYTHWNYQILESEHCDPEAFTSELFGPIEQFTTATAVNEFLGRLLALLARKRIAPRSAAILAYICQLLLSSLPAVQKETAPAEELPRDPDDFRAIEHQLPHAVARALPPTGSNGSGRASKEQGNDLKTSGSPRMLEGSDENRAGPVQSHRRGL